MFLKKFQLMELCGFGSLQLVDVYIRLLDIGVAIRQVAWNPLPELPILEVSV